jgi:hypothetical protein
MQRMETKRITISHYNVQNNGRNSWTVEENMERKTTFRGVMRRQFIIIMIRL